MVAVGVMPTPPTTEVLVAVGVFVRVAVAVGVLVFVGVAVLVGVLVFVGVLVGVFVGPPPSTWIVTEPPWRVQVNPRASSSVHSTPEKLRFEVPAELPAVYLRE
jgi:hypothetical protein